MFRKKVSVFRKKNLPPFLEYLDDSGIFKNYDYSSIKHKFSDKIFIKECNSIAYDTIDKYKYFDDNNKHYPGFNVTLGGSLDILHPYIAGCSHPECRSKEALNIARSVGLFANKFFISDHLSLYLARIENPKHIDNDTLSMMISVLNILSPLINNEVIEFRRPNLLHCKECFKKIKNQITNYLKSTVDCEANVTVSTLSSTSRYHDIEIDSSEFSRLCGLGSLYLTMNNKSYSTLMQNKKRISSKIKNQPIIMKILNDDFIERLECVITGTEVANNTSSLFMAKSELDTHFLSWIDGVNIQKNKIQEWEAMRNINLPWVGELDITQILKLREEASLSLELLRQQMTVAFMQGGQKEVEKVVAELTANTTELKQQILANNMVKKSKKSLIVKSVLLQLV
jgi:hypothetical protein